MVLCLEFVDCDLLLLPWQQSRNPKRRKASNFGGEPLSRVRGLRVSQKSETYFLEY